MKITLIGDSIRMQYEKKVKELLGEDFEVFSPKENCRFAKYTLRGLFEWSADMRESRIIHWNNGLWDTTNILGDNKLFSSEEEYIENIERIADVLLSKYDKVIFATTTPVSEKNIHNKNSDAERYNKLAIDVLTKKGVVINDLYTPLASDIESNVSSDLIHLSERGIEIAANQVANVILEEAKKLTNVNISQKASSTENSEGAPVIFQ